MPIKPQLYGRPIFQGIPARSLVDQVYEILVEEIHAGHWQEGERLPGVAALAEQSGLSRSPIQRAFDRLSETGYVRQQQRNGTFLETAAPEGRAPLGAIGIAVRVSQKADSLSSPRHSHYRIARIQEMAEAHNYATEIKYFDDDADISAIDQISGPFGNRVCGIIALFDFKRLDTTLKPGQIPLVFLGVSSENSLPLAKGDTPMGYWMLTRRVIEEGHSNIVFVPDPSIPDFAQAACLKGHRQAMREAGLEFQAEACRLSATLQMSDLSAVKDYLEQIRDATAIICMSREHAQNIIAVSDMMGRRAPDSLSIVCQDPGPARAHEPEQKLTCLTYNTDIVAEACFDLLTEQKKHRRSLHSRVLIVPGITEGHTLAAPRAEYACTESK